MLGNSTENEVVLGVCPLGASLSMFALCLNLSRTKARPGPFPEKVRTERKMCVGGSLQVKHHRLCIIETQPLYSTSKLGILLQLFLLVSVVTLIGKMLMIFGT